MTIAFIFCVIATVMFSMKQPAIVEYPVFLDVKQMKLSLSDETFSSNGKTLTQDHLANSAEGENPPLEQESSARDPTLSPDSAHSRPEFSQNTTNDDDIEDLAGTLKPHFSSTANDHSSGVPSRAPIRRLGSHSPKNYVPSWATETVPAILFGVFACGFGALHRLAWNSPFPTAKERLAWQICAATTTALPAVLGLILTGCLLFDILDDDGLLPEMLFLLNVLIAFLYILGRIILIVLAFMAFRALPEDAFQTVQWNQYIPHFSG